MSITKFFTEFLAFSPIHHLLTTSGVMQLGPLYCLFLRIEDIPTFHDDQHFTIILTFLLLLVDRLINVFINLCNNPTIKKLSLHDTGGIAA